MHPAANDAGIPLGAALYGYHVIVNKPFRPKYFSPFLGKRHAGPEVEKELELHDGITFKKPHGFYSHAAKLLEEGNIAGWFHGKSEHGPRALGNRSLIAHPTLPGIKDRLNETIKQRENFRPYAPAILEEKSGKYFKFKGKSPHMLMLADVRPAWRKRLAPVLHSDGTARLQTISKRDNPILRRLLEEFDALTRLPLLLNTSFNRSREPIVETPGDAINCFLKTGLDFLGIEGYIVRKK